MSASEPMRVRYVLGCLLAFGAINAVGGGIYGLSGAEGIPVQWLEGSPFASYYLPSLILLVVVGGSLLAATLAVFANARIARASAVSAGVILLAWILVQVGIIGYVSWMQPATAVGGLLILVLSRRLPVRGARNLK
jgi:hypothetical protein